MFNKINSLIGFVAELKRRKVVNVALTYLAGWLLLLQAADSIVKTYSLPQRLLTIVGVLAAIGFPIAIVLAWALEWTKDGIRIAERKNPIRKRTVRAVRLVAYGYLLLCMFIGTSVTIMWLLSRQIEVLAIHMALKISDARAQMMADVLSVYSNSVLSTPADSGASPPDLMREPGPVPSHLALLRNLDREINRNLPGAHFRLYSDHPYASGKGESFKDEFAQEALQQIRQKPDQPFFRFEAYENRPSSRYAIAARMHEDCVSCHNADPESPKRDWKVADVGGVIEVTRPLVGDLTFPRVSESALIVSMAIAAFALIGLSIVLARFKRAMPQPPDIPAPSA